MRADVRLGAAAGRRAERERPHLREEGDSLRGRQRGESPCHLPPPPLLTQTHSHTQGGTVRLCRKSGVVNIELKIKLRYVNNWFLNILKHVAPENMNSEGV